MRVLGFDFRRSGILCHANEPKALSLVFTFPTTRDTFLTPVEWKLKSQVDAAEKETLGL